MDGGYHVFTHVQNGFMYLVALIDVYSRYAVGWALSNTLDTAFCIDALKSGMIFSSPEIVNSDQGCQFTSDDYVITGEQELFYLFRQI